MQVNKSIKIFINYFLGPILFIWLSFSIYHQISVQPGLNESWIHIKKSFSSLKIFYLFSASLLILANWGLEALKWKLCITPVVPIKYLTAFQAVLSGVSFSVTMPNRVGEYLGRMLYLPEGNRLRNIASTLVGSFAQLLITFFVGSISLIFLKELLLKSFPYLMIWYQFILYGLIAITIALTLIYFNVAGGVRLFRRWIKNERYLYLIEALKNFDSKLLSKIILLSFLRYMVFIGQYILIFHLFDVLVPPFTIAGITSIIFLALAVIPSIALIEVSLRGEISIKLMGLFSVNSLGIGLTSITVWFINLILPAVIGSLLILNLKLFNKKNEPL